MSERRTVLKHRVSEGRHDFSNKPDLTYKCVHLYSNLHIVCVCKRESVCVCVRERECVRERACV